MRLFKSITLEQYYNHTTPEWYVRLYFRFLTIFFLLIGVPTNSIDYETMNPVARFFAKSLGKKSLQFLIAHGYLR